MSKTILIIATLDTKTEEVRFLKESIKNRGHNVLVVDAGILGESDITPEVTNQEVALAGGVELAKLRQSNDKGKCIAHMIEGAVKTVESLFRQGKFDAIIGIGGAQGAAIGTACMRAIPFGLPKLMVTPVASGRACLGDFVGTSDIAIMHSVVDMFGINTLSARILENAAGAVVGMVEADTRFTPGHTKPRVAMTILGNTTPAAAIIKELLCERNYEVVGFHANGTGGVAMEQMLAEGEFDAVLDLTTHEITDREFGGLHAAIAPNRLETAAKLGIPQVVVPGCIDYLVFGPVDTIADRFRDRPYVVHNPHLTLVRANSQEMAHIGAVMASKLNNSTGPVIIMVPTEGFSMHNIEGQVFFDPQADMAFLEVLSQQLRPDIEIRRVEAHINDPVFARQVCEAVLDLRAVSLGQRSNCEKTK